MGQQTTIKFPPCLSLLVPSFDFAIDRFILSFGILRQDWLEYRLFQLHRLLSILLRMRSCNSSFQSGRLTLPSCPLKDMDIRTNPKHGCLQQTRAFKDTSGWVSIASLPFWRACLRSTQLCCLTYSSWYIHSGIPVLTPHMACA